MDLESLPDRPLRLHEITAIKQNTDRIKNAEAVFYESNNINGAICVLININDIAHIIGYNKDEECWTKISTTEKNKSQYDNKTENVIEWINNMYGEDGYGIYGNYDDQ